MMIFGCLKQKVMFLHIIQLCNGNPEKMCIPEEVAIHAAENADMVKLLTMFVGEIKIYAIRVVIGLVSGCVSWLLFCVGVQTFCCTFHR